MRHFWALSSRLLVTFVCLALSACPLTFNVEINNKSDETLFILSGYSNVILSKIEPGEVEEVAYNFDCFRIRKGDSVLEYKPVVPPKEYVKRGWFSSTFKAVFSDGDVKIYGTSDDYQPSLYLKNSC
jgi:hypothetical protein